MAKLNQKIIVESLLADNERLIQRVKKIILLDENCLKQKVDLSTWSILECFNHMNKATELYLNQIEEKLSRSTSAKGEFYRSGLLAGFFIKGLKPTNDGKIKNKMKTLKAFIPENDSLDRTVIEQFLNNQNRLSKTIQVLSNKSLNSFKVTTALGKILKFNVGDALRFITAHNERHMLQAERIQQQIQNI